MAIRFDGPFYGPDDTPDVTGMGEVVDLGAARARRPAPDDHDHGSEQGTDGGPEVFEGEVLPRVDPPDAGKPGMVATALTGEVVDRRPVIPAWLRSRTEARQVARWIVAHYTHTTAYHAVRAPLYATKTAVRAPVGVWRIAAGTGRWVFDVEGRPLRRAAVDRTNAEEYLKLVRLRNDRVRLRLLVVAAGAAVGTVGLLVFLGMAPGLAKLAGLCAAAAILGWVGSPADKPLLGQAVVSSTRAQRLTSDIVARALGSLGIAEINRVVAKYGARGIAFVAPITRDGPGWRADVDLPHGVTVSDVMERRDRLASGLRRPLGCVWPEPVADEHTGRLVLWVGDQDMSKARQPAWPLGKSGRVDLFRPQPFGTDQRGRWVNLTLMFTSMVIGAIPRMGKTFALRLILLIAALDPRAELHVFDLKGTGDLSPLAPVAHRYRAGDDPDDIDYAMASARELREELRRRTKVIRDLPRDVCPENKVTPELASRKSLGLHPIVVGVDECQVLFEHPDYGKEFEEIYTDLTKRGPALGIILILATQRPDAKSLPSGISKNASTRFCLKVLDQTANDMVLGTSRYKTGVRATTFAWSDKGIGYLIGEGADATITRTVNLDAPAADRVATRARALRETAGTLSGYALGEQPDTTALSYSLLDDILAVTPSDEDKIWSETVIARLAELRPDVYTGWTPEQLAAALKPHHIDTVQIGRRIDGKTVNRRGIDRHDLTNAITERNRKRDAG